MKKVFWGLATVVLASLGTAAPAGAALIATIEGNDCAGVFGSGFDDCVIPEQYDANETPVIIKFNPDGTVSEINETLFPSVTGSEFSFNFDTNTWTYLPGEGDPLISFYVAKGGPNFNLFSNEDEANMDVWFTPTNPNNGQPYGLSHLTFYDTEGDGNGGGDIPVPEPAVLTLVGLAGLAARFARARKP